MAKTHTITFENLTKKQVQALQNALSYAGWQFQEGGDPNKEAEMVDNLHDDVEKQTGIKGEY